MRELFLTTLKQIDNCKTLEEIEILKKYVYDTFFGYKANSYFFHCRDRFNKQTAIIDGKYEQRTI